MLPEGLLSRTLALLPFPELHRCKQVCKAWASLIESPEFARRWTEIHGKEALLIVREHKPVPRNPFFKSRTDKFFTSRTVHQQHLYVISLPTFHSFLAASKGLLLVRSHLPEDERSSLAVVNPLTRDYKPLPLPPAVVPFLNEPAINISLFTEIEADGSCHYRILACWNFSAYQQVAVYYRISYDSRDDHWEIERSRGPIREQELPPTSDSNFLMVRCSPEEEDLVILNVYETETETWYEKSVKLPARVCSLIQYKHEYILAMLDTGGSARIYDVKDWKLLFSRQILSKKQLAEEPEGDSMSIWSVENLLIFGSRYKSSRPTIIYDMESRTSTDLQPKRNFLLELFCKTSVMECIAAFTPSLIAKP